ncbi:MAG TPA: PLP-dependent aminotransferase family protein [Pyrinomonadaceae bacterium]|nr:PLP-dependent aminotransferase family protein [Pyrinomonadaceae bacterium]
MWNPDITKQNGARYMAIADRIAEDIEHGELRPGEQMPTHRELALRLGVTVGTITRAYAEAQRRGLLVGETGRGTYVREDLFADAFPPNIAAQDDSLIDLSLNLPPVAAGDPLGQALSSTLMNLSSRPNLSNLLGYHTPIGAERHRAAGAAWISSRSGMEAEAGRVLITSGALHAMTVVFSTLTKPGDTVFTERLTYPGMKNLAHLLHLRLQGLDTDEHGIIPEAFERACRSGAVRVLYTIPTIHNPLGMVMPEERRREIARIAEEHDISIVEDDVHSFMLERPPLPLSHFAPERSYYILTTSKSIAGGMRIGYLLAPERMVERLATSLRSTVWMAAPLMAEIAAEWIKDGTAERLIEQKRREAEARQEMARRIFHGLRFHAHPLSFHLWLELPEPWRSDEFIAQARRRGVLVTPPEAFVPAREEAPHAVRVCLGGVRTRQQLEQGLKIVRELSRSAPKPTLSII